MKTWVAWGAVVAILAAVIPAAAQSQSGGGAEPPPQGPAYPPQNPAYQPPPTYQPQPGVQGEPAQPGMGRDPRMERRPVPQGQPAPQAPFTLLPNEEAQLDRVLQFWEQRSGQVKTFRSKFFRLEYDAAFANPAQPNQPQRVDKGEICYAAPDRGAFVVEDPRPEHWICNGRAVYEYDFNQKVVKEYKLPPEQQGKGITDGPLPFIFGAKAVQLKRRYWIRISTPPDAKDQVWLEVYPKFQQDAANFRRVDLILATENMLPFALQLHNPGGQSRTVYQFPPDQMAVNRKNPRDIFEDPFNPRVPRGWQMVSGDVPQAQGQALQPLQGQGGPVVGSRPVQGPPREVPR